MRHHKTTSNIVIIGFSTTGKSAVAKKVAEHLGWDLIDTDDEIIKLSNKAIPDIFEQDGEEKFRELERQVLKQTCQREKLVIATGGGAIIDPGNQKLLIEMGVVVCLEARAETIYNRLMQDTVSSSNPVVRPLLTGDDPMERIRQLKSSRQPYYAISDWTVHTDNLTLDEVCQEVIKGWRYVSRRNVTNECNAKADIACEVKTPTGYYPVFVGWGLLDELGEKMKQTGLSGLAVIISDETIFPLYGDRVIKSLKSSGFAVNHYLVPPGEASKNISQAVKIYDFLVEHRVERNDVIVALGGGVVGDLAGFIAATYLRGLRWLQVPTSLIAMSDASIGGKVAVDHPQGKNLIGAFYQPSLVLADVQTLSSLTQRELISGWAEVIKHGLILDSDFFQLLEDNAEDLIRLLPDITSRVISRSASIKAKIVSEDEKETGKRVILNYGHTIAHGLETVSKYERFLHGEAVSIGMMGAAKLSHNLGLLSQDVVQRQKALLDKFSLPVECFGINPSEVYSAMELDKKMRDKSIRWVLLKDIGKVVIRSDIAKKDVFNVLEEIIKP